MPPVCYVCFDGDKDMRYYRLMTAWNANTKFDFNFENAHDITQSRDTSSEETIKRSLRTRLKASDVLIVLIGESTKNLFRYVRWEIEVAIELGLSIIAVNLNENRSLDEERCPAILKSTSAIHVSYNPAIINYAINFWPSMHTKFSSPKIYSESTYKNLGL